MNTSNLTSLELVQGQQLPRSKVRFVCGNCHTIKVITRSSYLIRKTNSKSGILFCTPKCSSNYRWNKNKEEEESAQTILENWFKKPSLEIGNTGVTIGGVDFVTAPPEFFLFGESKSNLIAQSEQEKNQMAEERKSMTQAELLAQYPHLKDKIEYYLDDEGKLQITIPVPDPATVIVETPPAPPAPPAPPVPPTPAPKGTLNIGGGNSRGGSRFNWEYRKDGTTQLGLECDAGFHVIPDGFEATIPGGFIWELQGTDKVQAGQPLAKCTMNVDEFSGQPSRTFINVMGLAQFLSPEWNPNNLEPNHGQYRPSTQPCQRCMGLNELGQQISKGWISTRNLAFNWGFDKINKIIPQEMPFDGLGSYLAQRGLMLNGADGYVATPFLPQSSPANPQMTSDSDPFKP